MGRTIGYLIVIGVLLGLYVAAKVNLVLGIITCLGIAIGAPILLNLLFSKMDDAAEKKILKKREERNR